MTNNTENRVRLAEAKEYWMPIRYWEPYQVSNLGRVMGPRTILKPEVMHTGYHRVQMYCCGVKRRFMVHRLVLDAFRGPCPDGHEAAHLDGDRANNRLSNLDWVTPRENAAQRIAHGTQVRGTDNHTAKLTEDDVRRIRSIRHQFGTSITALASAFGVSFSTINRIIRRELWTHVR